MDTKLDELAKRVSNAVSAQGLKLAVAESCTGGWLAKLLTDIPGSSQWFECGYVTYSNQSKQRSLGVGEKTLHLFGAVSEEVVREMTAGALTHSEADLALAISGIAGPDGGSIEKPVGTVWFSWGEKDMPVISEIRLFEGDRRDIRAQAVEHALAGILKIVDES